jgi:hypothetical protein
MVKQTYVAEIDGEAIAAFPARNELDANARINGRNGIAYEMIGRERPNGTALWDRESPVKPRLATDQELETVRELFSAFGFRYATSGEWVAYLTPTRNDRSRPR